MANHEIDPAWVHMIDGKYTFCGVLDEFYADCAKNWKENTRSQYNKDYNEKILPNLRDHDDKPIDDYTREDYDAAIETIMKKGQGKEGELFAPYADATIQHYRHLIEVVVSVASAKGICDNVLWGSSFILSEQQMADDELNERVKLKKSLTPSEEATVARMLLMDIDQRGQNLGLLLMFALGLRNGEACGVNYGDIRPMQYHQECKVLWVYKSTAAGSNVLKSSGKTRNADRIIPIPTVLERYLLRRQQYLQQIVKFDPSDEIQSVDDLPIACVDDDYTQRCSASRLTAAGREMFRRIRLREKQLAYIDAELSQTSGQEGVKEKDPTAYLLRRNFGTHLHILGLAEPEIEYIIGHDISDAYETRNEFVNEEKLYEIKLKLDQRPILNDIDKEAEVSVVQLSPSQCYQFYGSWPQKLRIGLSPGCLKIHLYAKEPLDKLEMRFALFPQTAMVRKHSFISTIQPRYERYIDIIKLYHKVYHRLHHIEKP